MSLYGDYIADLISDSEYTRLAREEYLRDRDDEWSEEDEFDDENIDELELF